MEFKGIRLDRFQEEAVQFIKEGCSVLVSAPTGAGKTLIAEYVVEDALNNGREVVYTAPIKALSNQKYRDFSGRFPGKVGIVTGDVSLNSKSPLLVMTTEIFRNMALVNPDSLSRKEWIIFDEIHFLDDIDRGTVWEEAIMLLPKHIRILALSATVPNIDSIAGWISAIHNFPVRVVKEETRPVPLKLYFQCSNEFFSSFETLKKSRFLTEKESVLIKKSYRQKVLKSRTDLKSNKIYTLFERIEKEGNLPCIYFSFSRKRCEYLAEEVSAKFDFFSRQESRQSLNLYNRLLDRFGVSSNPTAVYLASLVKKGIAFHHAGILPSLKEIIEVLFTQRRIKAIFTTETFALGINMPAKAVVFDDLKKFSGRSYQYIKTRDFYQIAGRAGRRGIDRQGCVYLRVMPLSVSLENLASVIYSVPEKISSQFKSNYATVLNLYRDMQERIYEIYPLSFHFFSSGKKDKNKAVEVLKNKVGLLKEIGYIGPGHKLTWPGELASRVYGYELAVGQMYKSGYLLSLAPRELALVLIGLVYEPRKGVRAPAVSRYVRPLKKEMDLISKFIIKKERQYNIYPPSKRFYFYLAEPMRLWFDGIRFSRLLKYTQADEGEIVRYFRMVLQVLREFALFEGFKKDFKNKVKECFGRINRDVVNAEEQLKTSAEV